MELETLVGKQLILSDKFSKGATNANILLFDFELLIKRAKKHYINTQNTKSTSKRKCTNDHSAKLLKRFQILHIMACSSNQNFRIPLLQDCDAWKA